MSDLAFENLNEIIFMDGHGIYVWSVFFIVIVSLTLMFAFYNNQLKKIKKNN